MATYQQANADGNAAFKVNDFTRAADKFTIGLSLSTDSSARGLLLSNRSATFVKLGKLDEAIADARECVNVRPDWTKAYLRLGQALEAKGRTKDACNVYVDAMKRGNEHKALLLQPLITANEKCNLFSEEFMTGMQLGETYCIICQKESELLRCSRCHTIYYCSVEHQRRHWPKHKVQCRELAAAKEDKDRIRSLQIKDLPLSRLLEICKQFSSLKNITNWETFWEYFRPKVEPADLVKRYMTRVLSWPLTLAASLCKFDMDRQKDLRLHVIGADDTERNHLEIFSIGILPLPNIEMILVGPELTASQPVQIKTATGSTVSIKCVTAIWHEFIEQADFVSPDLIIAYHPGIFDFSYPWRPTLRKIVMSSIPSIFTCWDEDELKQTLDVLNDEMLNANILFEGPSQFPSFFKRSAQKEWNKYTIVLDNSYWVGFCGGSTLTDQEINQKIESSLASFSGMSLEDFRKAVANPDDAVQTALADRIREAITPGIKASGFVQARKLLDKGVTHQENMDFLSACDCFRRVIKECNMLLKVGTRDNEHVSLLIQAHLYLGFAIARQGNINGGIEEIEKAVDIDPDNYLPHFNLGLMYEKKGHFHDMEDAFIRATELCPSEPDLVECRKGLQRARYKIKQSKYKSEVST